MCLPYMLMSSSFQSRRLKICFNEVAGKLLWSDYIFCHIPTATLYNNVHILLCKYKYKYFIVQSETICTCNILYQKQYMQEKTKKKYFYLSVREVGFFFCQMLLFICLGVFVYKFITLSFSEYVDYIGTEFRCCNLQLSNTTA